MEEFGVSLKLVTDAFKRKIKEAQSIANKVKYQFVEGWSIKSDDLEEMKGRMYELGKELNELIDKKDKLSKGPVYVNSKTGKINTSQMDQVQDKIRDVLSSMKDVQITFDAVTSKVGTFGMKVRETFPQTSADIWSVWDVMSNVRKSISHMTNSITNVAKRTLNLVTSFRNVRNAIRTIPNAIKSIPRNALGFLDKGLHFIFSTAKRGAMGIASLGNSIRKLPSTILEKVKNKIRGIGSEASKSRQQSGGLGQSLKGVGRSITGAFSKGLSSIKRFTINLLGAGGAMMAIRRATSAYLQKNQELQDSLNNSWALLGSIFAPILERVISLFATLSSYVVRFVQALTGINLAAKANSKALNQQASAGAAAQKSLAGFDEINNLDSESGGGGGTDTSGINVEDVDMSWMDSFMEKLSRMFEPFKNAWETTGATVIDSMKGAFDSITGLIQSIGESFASVWTNGTGQTAIENILNLVSLVLDTVNGINSSITEAWDNAETGTGLIQSVFDAFNGISEFAIGVGESMKEWAMSEELQTGISMVLQLFTTIFNTVKNISGALLDAWKNAGSGTSIFMGIQGIINSISEFVLDIAETINKWVVSEDFQTALNAVVSFINDIIQGVADICSWILDMWNKYASPVVEGHILPMITDVINAIMDIWNGAVKPVIDFVIDILKTVLEPAIEFICGVIGGISDIIGDIAKIAGDVFGNKIPGAIKMIQDAWDTVWGALSGAIKAPINAVLGFIESFINFIIKGVNFIIGALNTISFDVPDWVPFIGGQHWGINLKKQKQITLPRLDVGTGYVPNDMLAQIHEGEAVIPKKFNNREYFGDGGEKTAELLEQLIDVVENLELNPYITVKDIGEANTRYNSKQTRVMGGAY